MLSVERFPSVAPGPQRLSDCYYREREAPPPLAVFPTSCDMAARAPPPRSLAPPPVATETGGKEQVKMELESASLWKQFSAVGTEMIITKKGRRMFPGLSVRLSGLNPALRYILLLDVVPVDGSRYRFHGDAWQTVGEAEARLPDRVFIHPDSPATGAHWLGRSVSFHRAKLTNHTLDAQGHIILHSLHRYQPRLHVMEARDMLRWGGGQTSFIFPETQFLTVTAYQNPRITELKINSNPFAKGFREDGRNCKKQRDARQKRKMSEPLDGSEPSESSRDLQGLVLDSLPQLQESSCGFREEDPPQVPEQHLDLGHAFIASHINDITASLANEMQDTAGSHVTDQMIDRSDPSFESGFISAPPPPPPPPPPSSYTSLPDGSDSTPAGEYPSLLSSSSPSSLHTSFSSYPVLTPPPSATSSPLPLLPDSPPAYPSLTPGDPQGFSPHTPLSASYPPAQLTPPTQDHTSPTFNYATPEAPPTHDRTAPPPPDALSTPTAFPFPPLTQTPTYTPTYTPTPTPPLTQTPTYTPTPPLTQTPTYTPTPPLTQTPTYTPTYTPTPSLNQTNPFPPAPALNQSQLSYPPLNQSHLCLPHAPPLNQSQLTYSSAPPLNQSQLTYSSAPPLNQSQLSSFPLNQSQLSYPPLNQSQLSLPHAPPLNQSQLSSFPLNQSQLSSFPLNQSQLSSFPHSFPSSFTHPSFQSTSCFSGVSSSHLPPPSLAFSSSHLPPSSLSGQGQTSSSFFSSSSSPAELHPGSPYLPDMMLHLPALSSSSSSSSCSSSQSSPGPTLYSSFPSYPLRLCPDPRAAMPVPLRHVYRQPQPPQGSYLDMGPRAAF
ncbi:unnamed protein product [Merluccius merluccius]